MFRLISWLRLLTAGCSSLPRPAPLRLSPHSREIGSEEEDEFASDYINIPAGVAHRQRQARSKPALPCRMRNARRLRGTMLSLLVVHCTSVDLIVLKSGALQQLAWNARAALSKSTAWRHLRSGGFLNQQTNRLKENLFRRPGGCSPSSSAASWTRSAWPLRCMS